MESRYSQIFKSDSFQVEEGCPVSISAAALLFDAVQNNYIIQAKVKNESEKIVKKVVLNSDCTNVQGKSVENGKNEIVFSEMINPGESFGDRQSNYINAVNPQILQITVKQVVFDDGSTWESSKAKKTKKGIKLAIIIAAIVVVIVGAFFAFLGIEHGKVVKLAEEGNYIDAKDLAIKLHMDSWVDEVRYYQAMESFNNGDYENARFVFDDIKDYKNSEEMIKECAYLLGKKYVSEDKNDMAADFFDMIPDYKDAADLGLEAKYNAVKKDIDTFGFCSDSRIKRFINDLSNSGVSKYMNLADEVSTPHIEVLCINSSPNDLTSNKTTFGHYEHAVIHYKVKGGYDYKKYKITTTSYWPSNFTTPVLANDTYLFCGDTSYYECWISSGNLGAQVSIHLSIDDKEEVVKSIYFE